MIKLFYTDSLPMQYVAEDEQGAKWIIPCTPMSSEVWARKKPYHGNYTLHPVQPESLARAYDPGEKVVRELSLRFRVTAAEKAKLDAEAAEAWVTLSQYVREKLGL